MKRNKLVVYTTNTWESPLAHLRFLGPARHAGQQVVRGNDGTAIFPERVAQADLVVIQRDFPRHGKAYEQITARAQEVGKPVVFELDDLLLELPETHPDRITHYYGAALLPMLRAILEADLITVSTAPLADYLQQFQVRARVLPNYLDDHLWEIRPPREPAGDSEPVIIGYMGSAAHAQDLGTITPALLKVARRYGARVSFHFLGVQPPPELSEAAQVHWEPAPTYEYAKFARAFPEQPYHLALAPLQNNLFNRCKSAIKFLEYSALGVPGVYSRLETYSAAIRHGHDGFLAEEVDEWEACLSQLIEQPDLRYAMACHAQATLKQDWLLSAHAQEWAQAYDRVELALGRQTEGAAPESRALISLAQQTQEYQRYAIANEQAMKTRLEELNHLAGENRHTIQALQAELEQAQMDRDSFSRQLWAIQNSRAWQRVLRWRAARQGFAELLPSWIAPPERPAIPAGEAIPAPQAGQAVARHQLEGSPESFAISLVSGIEIEGQAALLEFSAQATNIHYDVIVLPVMDWTSRRQRPQQIALQFARAGHRVFYVKGTFRSAQAALVRPVHPNIFEVELPGSKEINLYQEAMSPALHYDCLQNFIRLKKAFQISQAVCLVDLPFWTPLAISLRREFGWRLVYDCMDYHAGFSTNTEAMLRLEDELSRESDLVLATSHLLWEEKRQVNPNCLRVPNGVEFEHFRFPGVNPPAKLAGVPGPIIGYFGAIADWFDTELIRTLAQARPSWQFVLIGSTLYADLEPLSDLENVHLLGELPYASLPAYLQRFDVATIPFKQTPLTEATNPVKLFEYLSAGKPVVATRLKEIEHYQEHVRLARTPEEWLAALDSALDDHDQTAAQARQEFARQNTWEQRFAQIHSGIQNLYPLASLIILTYNNLDYTRLCLESIFAKTQYPHYEVILVDNASSDDTPVYLQEMASLYANLQVILNAENRGFAAGNNQGAAAARGEVLVFLNNDTVVTPGWLNRLVKHLEDYDTGMVGPVTNMSGNETRIEVTYDSLKNLDEFAARYVAEHAGQSFEIRMLAFLCVALRREVFQAAGPLDEGFGIGMFEDDDYARRVRAKGYKIICAEDVFIHHWGSASFSKLEKAAYQRLFEENRRKFEAKWGAGWHAHQGRENPESAT